VRGHEISVSGPSKTVWHRRAGRINCAARQSREPRVSANGRHLLSRDPSHFAKTIIREILSLTLFDGLQNEAGDEFWLVAIGVIG
jgi:hypothetical protein